MKRSLTVMAAVLSLLAAGSIAQAATMFAVQDSTGAVDKMVVTDTGFIGTGTNTPSVAVNLVGNTPASSQVLTQFNGVTTATGGGGFIAYHNNAAGALPNANDRLGYFLFGSYNGTTPLNGAGLTAKAEAAWTPTSFPSFFVFETTATNNRTEKMRITGAGNVGIGTTTPSQKLEVQGGIKFGSVVKPTCDATVRGTMWYSYQGAGLADTFEVCSKDAAGAYAWRLLF